MSEFKQVLHTWDTVISVKVISQESIDDPETLELAVTQYAQLIDDLFSTFKEDSVITLLNTNRLPLSLVLEAYPVFKEVYDLAIEATKTTNGLFDFLVNGAYDYNAIVKGYAAQKIVELLKDLIPQAQIIMVSAGGDCAIFTQPHNPISIGLTDPDDITKTYQTIQMVSGGVATSGTYIRGSHITSSTTPFLSASVWGPNPALADAYATAALLSNDLNLSWLPVEYQYSIITQPNSKVVYQSNNSI